MTRQIKQFLKTLTPNELINLGFRWWEDILLIPKRFHFLLLPKLDRDMRYGCYAFGFKIDQDTCRVNTEYLYSINNKKYKL